jgi:hypothetical protein
MNPPQSIDEYKTEIARYLDAFARSMPTQINAPAISRVKLPGIATWSRETLFWRFVGLAQDALEKLGQNRLPSAMLLTRAAVETTAALWYLEAKIKQALASSEIAELDEALKRLVFGQKDPAAHVDGLPMAINVMTFLKHVEREIPGYTGHYERLCEYSHPNYYGVAGIFSQPHKETGLIDLGSNIRGGQSHDLICAASLSGATLMFHHSYEALADTLPALVTLCERLVPPL